MCAEAARRARAASCERPPLRFPDRAHPRAPRKPPVKSAPNREPSHQANCVEVCNSRRDSGGSAELLRNDVCGEHRVGPGQLAPRCVRKRERREGGRRELRLEPLELGTGRGEDKARSWRPGLCPISITEVTPSGTARIRSSSSWEEAAYSFASSLTVDDAPRIGRTSVSRVRSAEEQRTSSGSIPSRTRCLAIRFASRRPLCASGRS